ncbi:MAG TPA: SRPBCC domain-containing protein [Actinomycetota bacterium]
MAVPISPGEAMRMSIATSSATSSGTMAPWRLRKSYDGSRTLATRRLQTQMEQEPVTRSIELDAAQPEVWRALTEASLLADWFEADVELDAHANGAVRFRFADGSELRGVVVAWDPPRRLSFRWRDVHAPGSAAVVAFSLEPVSDGTRLTVTESPGVVSAKQKLELVAR